MPSLSFFAASTSANTSFATCCPVCGGEQRQYLFVVHGLPVARCPGCELLSVFPFPSQVDYQDFYQRENNGQVPVIAWGNSLTEIEASQVYLDRLRACQLPASARLLLIAPLDHPFAGLAGKQGLLIGQHLTTGQIEAGQPLVGEFDAVVCLFQFEKVAQPDKLLLAIRNVLTQNGILFLLLPSLDSLSARVLGRQWTEWRPENRYYFSQKTIQLLLWRSGFEHLEIRSDRRKYSIDHIYDRAKTFPRTFLTGAIRLGSALVPRGLRQTRLQLPTSAMIVTARKGQKNEVPVCSIVIPAYNEGSTFTILMDALLEKQLTRMKKEIVIVESNSKDGTREQVLKYKDVPSVKIVLQEAARGKGNAVREGFSHATGDIILIQDADLEYDLNDYEALLEPLLNFRAAFVLGSRHGGRWKMRQFEDQAGLSSFLNFGHVFFASLVNILYGQRMKDPFTMFKVFRRDCLHNLKFECNRFDFDFELVIKLIRKGYVPLEIPVNYASRSFKDGKKVNMFRDPLTWIKAAFKYRFVKITKD